MSFAALGGEKVERLNLVVRDEGFPVRVSFVTDGFFTAFGVGTSQGRVFAAEDYQSAYAGITVVLSHPAWTKFFRSEPDIVGQDIVVGGRMRRVIGVLSPDFVFKGTPMSSGDGVYVSAPLEINPGPGFSNVNAIGQLKPQVTMEHGEAELRTIRPEMPPRSLEMFSTPEPYLSTLPNVFREDRARPFLIFLGAAGLLHLIGCSLEELGYASFALHEIRRPIRGTARGGMECILAALL